MRGEGGGAGVDEAFGGMDGDVFGGGAGGEKVRLLRLVVGGVR